VALAPGLRSPRSALGRADLLRLLVAWGEGAEQVAAGLTGFAYQAAQTAKPEREEAADSVSAHTAAPPAPPSIARPRSEQYSATLIQAPDVVLASDFAQRQADIDNASPPPEPPEPFAPPLMIALSSTRRLVVLTEKHLRSLHPTPQWDVAKLVQQVAFGLPPKKRRAQQQRLRWRGNAMVISMRRETEPLHADYRALARIVQRRSGGQVPIYLHYQGEGWAVFQPQAESQAQLQSEPQAQRQAQPQSQPPGRALPRLWRELAQAPQLAGMGGLAVGWPTFPALPWSPAAMLAACLPADALGAAAPAAGAAGSASVGASGAASAAAAHASRAAVGVDSGVTARLSLACWDVGQPLHLRRQVPSQLMQASDAQVARLLAVLTLAVVADVRLLRALRCMLGLPACTEVQVWGHADVACNGVVITLRAARRDEYRAILHNEITLALRQKAVALIAAHHGLLSFDILLEESQRAALDAPGSALLDHAAWFASMVRQMREAKAQGQVDFALNERMAYLARQGHRTPAALWGQSAEFSLAWAWANRAALQSGKGLPASLPLTLMPALCQLVGGDPASLPQQGLRLRQVDGLLQFEMVDVAQLQARTPVDVLAQWVSRGLLKWRGGQNGNWHSAAWAHEMEPIELARHAPLELTDGQTTCIVQREVRPAWALEWGRDRAGLYALMPNPWGAPLRVPYPRAAGARRYERVPVPAVAPTLVPAPAPKRKRKPASKSTGKTGFAISDLALGLDEIGPFATLTVTGANGQHTQTFRYIAPGRFLMGSPEAETAGLGDQDWFERERPQHYVTISAGFWLADTACTQGFWQAIMNENPSDFNDNNQGGPNHPVEQVSWNDIQPFLRQLQTILPDCYAGLPTEAEWEYACRAGTSTPFYFGSTISTGQVNYNGRHPYGGGPKGEWRGHTVAVTDLPPNGWGLYQMHGNVWEWCADQPRTYAPAAVKDPGLAEALQPASDNDAVRALRGGSWVRDAQSVRSAIRYLHGPVRLSLYAGFRLALRSSGLASGF
jgi:formylglycine-generating enzyme required for sulfatase activity